MNSAFLTKMGLGNVDIGYFFLITFILLIVIIIGFAYVLYENIRFRKAYKKFMKGSTAESLEEKIFQMCEEQDSIRKLGLKHSREIKDLYAKHQLAFQKVGLVKYDAFKEMGGKLITFGSDSHFPGTFAVCFSDAVEYIKSLGFKESVYFKDRKPVFESL